MKDIFGVFEVFNSFFWGGELIIIEDPSLSAHGYQLLSLATIQQVGKNMKFDVSGKCYLFYSLLVEGSL